MDLDDLDHHGSKEEPNLQPMDEDNHHSDHPEVVREINVFLVPPLGAATQLIRAQFPLRPSWDPYNLGDKVRLDPNDGEMELDVLLDTKNNYNNDVADKLKITKKILSGQKKPLEASYAAGLLQDNKLYLNPIDANVQYRPSMDHLNSGLKDSSSSKRQSWILLDYHGKDSSESSLCLKKMMTTEESFEIPYTLIPYEYIASLCPDNQERSLPKKELECQLYNFQALKDLASDQSTEKVLDVLQKHFWLVQGLWVPKSSVHKTRDALARDYVLSLFEKNTSINFNFKDIEVYPPLFRREVRFHLNKLANKRGHIWELKEAKDVSFINSHPEIVKEQEMLWKNQNRKILLSLNKYRTLDTEGAKVNVIGTDGIKIRSMSDVSIDLMRTALEALLQEHGVCSWSMICKSLKNQRILEWGTAPPPELRFVIDQIAVEICGVYVLKSLGDPEHDRLRGVVIELFRVHGRETLLVKDRIITEAASRDIKNIPDKVYKKVMHEFCDVRGTSWALKRGES